MKHALQKFWMGDQPLGIAFWRYFIAAWFLIVIIAMVVHTLLFSVGLRPIGLFVLAAAYVGYPIFASVGVWRSANKFKHNPFYKNAAKATVCLLIGWISWKLVNGGALRVMEFLTSR